MADLLNDWLNRIATESVNGLASGIRDEAADRAEGRGPWDGVTRVCRTCARPSLSLEDGECPGCLEGAEEKAERVRRANESARSTGYRNAAALLERLAEDKGINSTFRAVLREDAAVLRRRAS